MRRNLYRKNLRSWEQRLRVAASVALALFAVIASLPGWVQVALVATAAFGALTGVVGYCPACALVGKKFVEE